VAFERRAEYRPNAEGNRGPLGLQAEAQSVPGRKRSGAQGGSLEPPGQLLPHLHTVYIAYSERLSTRLKPLPERTCFSFPLLHIIFSY
jgi:hypothetical protein